MKDFFLEIGFKDLKTFSDEDLGEWFQFTKPGLPKAIYKAMMLALKKILNNFE
jgi:hypothetical protein